MNSIKSWTHFDIANALPGKAWGTGGIGLADFDGKGCLEVAVSRRETLSAYWFKRRADDKWDQYTIGTTESLSNCLGAVAVDVDQDGWIDMVFNQVWFKNPGNLAIYPETPWEAIPFEGGGHDIVAADLNGDGWLDIIAYDGNNLVWFDTSNGLRKTIIAENLDHHGGIAPKGFGDINGNGLIDLVIPGFWYANPGDGDGRWEGHPWPHVPIPDATYGTSMRVWITDINGNGWNDIVYSDCDTGESHVYWVENCRAGQEWIRHKLTDPPGDPRTGSFHSLGVADFNRDGRLEIFAGEQEDPDTSLVVMGKLPMKPPGLEERGVIWVNQGLESPDFVPIIIHQGRPGWHDVVLGDIDGDGDIDMVSKVWNADGPNYHLDFWRNDIG
jgi:hypothetical protein